MKRQISLAYASVSSFRAGKIRNVAVLNYHRHFSTTEASVEEQKDISTGSQQYCKLLRFKKNSADDDFSKCTGGDPFNEQSFGYLHDLNRDYIYVGTDETVESSLKMTATECGLSIGLSQERVDRELNHFDYRLGILKAAEVLPATWEIANDKIFSKIIGFNGVRPKLIEKNVFDRVSCGHYCKERDIFRAFSTDDGGEGGVLRKEANLQPYTHFQKFSFVSNKPTFLSSIINSHAPKFALSIVRSGMVQDSLIKTYVNYRKWNKDAMVKDMEITDDGELLLFYYRALGSTIGMNEYCSGVGELIDEKEQIYGSFSYDANGLRGYPEFWHPNGKLEEFVTEVRHFNG